MANISIKPGAPFWLAFTAFASCMISLFGVDTLDVWEINIEVEHWWNAVIISVIVGGAVYGKAKVDEVRGSDEPAVIEE